MGVEPQSIAYFTGELFVDHLSLIRQLQRYLENMPKHHRRYIIIDEITYIKSWDMGIKFLADGGLLEDVILILTGSDLAILKEAKMRFPGRRGMADKVDFHIHPLSFYEMLTLTNKIKHLDEHLQSDAPTANITEQFDKQFQQYLIHGGYLTAINNYASTQRIDKAVLDTYADWIRGDVIKHGKSDHHCEAFFNAMIKRLNSQITWNSLAKDVAIQHHATLADYAALLMSMDAVYIQQALIEDKLVGAIKKARKLIFTDPFIYHAIYAWLNPVQTPFEEQIMPALLNSNTATALVEACVSSHYRRWYPTYYIKAEGEVDIAFINNKKFWPIEIKWTQQLRAKDLKQIQKYKNGIILAKQSTIRDLHETPCYPLAWYLAKISREHYLL